LLVSPFSALEHTAIALAIALLLAVALERARVAVALPVLLSILAAASVVVLVALVVNHVTFPFHLDLMEGVVMQHARRAMHGDGLYPLPTPEFVPLAYNALFYIVAAPFLRVFGDSLPTLRMVSVLGMVGSAAATFFLVRSYARSVLTVHAGSRSMWWAAIATGLFCASYSAMDAYLDTAHSDAWLLCCALWGTYLVTRSSRGAHFAGILVLVAGFWFKQHGAIFVGAALVYLAWREGIRESIPYWLIAVVLGPVLYALAPESIFGADFHFFTWHVPSGWSQFGAHTIPRVLLYVAAFYPALAFVALAGVWRAVRTREIGLLELQLAASALTAFMGSLDPGSSYNVFIPLAAFTIVYGVGELARLSERVPNWRGMRPAPVIALLAFATVLHDPRDFWLPDSAGASYADLQSTIRALPGKVYAPGIGQFADSAELFPAAHWVALDDMMRGPHRTAADSALARSMLDPIRHPAMTAYVLTNHPLATLAPPVSELAGGYALVTDYGARFSSLAALPRRFDHGYPRYLYRSTTAEVAHAP
jgi:4-amino-4-deoxy-L-arabinose transferase-like glycosyltransferase